MPVQVPYESMVRQRVLLGREDEHGVVVTADLGLPDLAFKFSPQGAS